MEEGKIKLTFRQNSGSQFEAVVAAKSTVRELKESIVSLAGYSADEMRLIFKGMSPLIANSPCRKDIEGRELD